MRSGVCIVRQALNDEVASVLKHSVNLARRRGHAQVTPLHVAATLISSSSESTDVLRGACLKSQPHHPATHPLQCRALELCFNVALNRLPTTAPPSSGSLHPSPSSLSNSLIAVLKRAQANQRRGCIELQQQQPLLAIKVEMEQLMLSILDDPSVSRVMKEAGFSSSSVKSKLEEEASSLSQSSPFLLDSGKDVADIGRKMWQCPGLGLASKASVSEELSSVIEAMLRKQGRNAHTVVVGDSASMTEGLVTELKGRLERNEVPDELRNASFINLQFSANLRLMNKGEVDMKLSDLRSTINSLTSDRVGIVIYAGDLSWIVEEEPRDGCGFNYDPVEHMVAEMGRIFSEFKSSINDNRLWLLATASYSTYWKCQIRQPCLATLWALQAVVVPSGWLGLDLQVSSCLNSRVLKFDESSPSQLLQSKIFSSKENEMLLCCDDCTFNYEKEALIFKSETTPRWLQATSEIDHKKALPELKRKWTEICRNLHQNHYSPFFNQSLISTNYTGSLSKSNSWWPDNFFSNQNSKTFIEQHSLSFSAPIQKFYPGFSIVDKKNKTGNSSEGSFSSLKISTDHQVKTTLALSNPSFSDSATSKNQTKLLMADPTVLQRQLQVEIHWQSKSIPLIMEALHECVSGDKKSMMLLIKGTDFVAKRRLASVIAKSFFGSTDKIIQIKQNDSCCATLLDALRKDQKRVVLMEDFCQMKADFIKSFTDAINFGSFKGNTGEEVSLADAVFILTTSKCSKLKDASGINKVVTIKLCASSCYTKRKSESDLESLAKKPRKEDHSFDLNFVVNSNTEEENVPSDLTQEAECISLHLPQEFLKSTVQLTLDAGHSERQEVKVNLLLKLHRAFAEVQTAGNDGTGQLFIDPEIAEELMQASHLFSESFFEKWVTEVLQPSLLTAAKGGNLRLSLDGKESWDAEEFGFMASVLPNRINVD